ncbi:hypothetical protein [Novosphingobium sp. KN65.2]|uniref:hypothetical protein n=1 Tax=Novosphingobium sp. KN65.2 TaxID=1478134 RepID=UPI0012E2782D|nr:hypothetical protein [Novosphingobium sp. KN65.2]
MQKASTLLSVTALALAIASVTAAPLSIAAPQKSKAEPAQCTKLRTDYDDASKKLALAQAYDVLDHSAIRSTMRNSENSNVIAQARMTFDIMKGQGCSVPDYTPSAGRYGLQSLQCASALQEQRTKNAFADLDNRPRSYETPKECDTTAWTHSTN